MTNEEAIYCLTRTGCAECKHLIPCTNNGDGSYCFEAQKMGAEALEKQIPKKCRPFKDTCECGHTVFPHMKFCVECGKKIDWSKEK